MRRILAGPALVALAACTPRVYHREAQRPVPSAMDAYRCAAVQAERMGYELRDWDPGVSFAAARARPQPADARYPVYDYLVMELLDDGRGGSSLRVGAVTLAGGGGGVAPHFRAPLPKTEADRDGVLDACAGAPASS